MSDARAFVPAPGYAWLTRFYDPVVALTRREGTFKRLLIEQAGLAPGQAVLELGCGTGTLAVGIKRAAPGAHVRGLDGDPEVLRRARVKARRHRAEIAFDEGLSTDLPYGDACFDRVLSSLFFHHLPPADKRLTSREVHRVLEPGGEFHVADWGKPRNAMMAALFAVVRTLDGAENTSDNVEGRLPDIFAEDGLIEVQGRRELAAPLGMIALYSMRKSGVGVGVIVDRTRKAAWNGSWRGPSHRTSNRLHVKECSGQLLDTDRHPG